MQRWDKKAFGMQRLDILTNKAQTVDEKNGVKMFKKW